MFKKIFITLGIIFIILLALIISGIGFAIYNGTKLDASSKAYLDENLPPILSTWSSDELLNRASPELRKVATPEQIRKLCLKFNAAFGPLQKIESTEGDSNMSYTSKAGKRLIASYKVKAKFQKADATIDIQLIQHDGKWQFMGFQVNFDSPPAEAHNSEHSLLSPQ